MKYVTSLVVVVSLGLSGCDSAVVPSKASPTASPSPTKSTSSSSPATSTPKSTSTATATTTAAAAPTYSPPSLHVTAQAGAEAAPLTFNLGGSDPQSLALTYSCQSGCPAGLVVGSASGQVNWTPSYGQANTYSVIFGVTNGKTSLVTSPVSVTIAHTNRPPSIGAISSQSINAFQTLNLTVTTSDPDGDAVTITTSALPANATYSAGTFSFTPTDAQAGSYTVTFYAHDSQAVTSEDVTINVNYVDQPPTMASIPNQNAAQQQAVNFSVSATDPESEAITYSASGLPPGATFIGNAFAWTPSCGQAGSWTPTFTATDTNSLTDTKTANITISSVDNVTPTWNTGVAPSLSGTSGNNTIAYAGIGSYLGAGSLTYAYVAEFECNNKTWTKSFNASTRQLSLTNPYGSTDGGMHSFLISVADACGSIYYRFVQVTGYSASFSIQKLEQSSTYSTAGLCGGGTVYQH